MQLYNNILPEGFKLHKDPYDDMFYINKGADTYFSDESICYLIFHVDKKENELNVMKLEIKQEYRGKGIGTYMMIVAARFHSEMKMTLDDMSAKSRKPNNIYKKLGLKYVDPDTTEPEMEGSCKVVGDNWGDFVYRYIDNGFFS